LHKLRKLINERLKKKNLQGDGVREPLPLERLVPGRLPQAQKVSSEPLQVKAVIRCKKLRGKKWQPQELTQQVLEVSPLESEEENILQPSTVPLWVGEPIDDEKKTNIHASRTK